MLAMFTYNFLNYDDNLKSPIDKHLEQNRPAVPHPLVSYKDPLVKQGAAKRRTPRRDL